MSRHSGEPDVQSVGWVTDQPGGTLRRRRNPLLLIVTLVLLAAGAVGLIGGILVLAGEGGPGEDDIVAEGTVAPLGRSPSEPARFTAGGAEDFTVWLQTDGLFETNNRETVIAATACDARLTNGDTPDFQGNRQGHAVTIGDQSTVGWFTAAEGAVEVSCGQVEFGRVGRHRLLQDEHPFVVARGKPSFEWAGFGFLAAGIIAIVAGAFVAPRWHRGRLGPA